MNIKDLDINNSKQVEQFVDELMTSNSSVGSEIAPFITPVVTDFIPANVDCQANLAFANPFALDDKQMYIDFLNHILQNNNIDNIQKYIPNTLLSCFNFVTTYFGGQTKELREQINESQNGKHSITTYKGNNSAVCFERATVTHNLLTLLGLEDTLILNKGHAYNMVDCGNGKHILFDVTNWSRFKGDGVEVDLPIIQIVKPEQFEQFYYGTDEIKFDKDALTRFANLIYPNKNMQLTNGFDFTYPGLNQPMQQELSL